MYNSNGRHLPRVLYSDLIIDHLFFYFHSASFASLEVKAGLALSFHSDIVFRHDRSNQLRRGDIKALVIHLTFGLSNRTGRDEYLGLHFITRGVVGGRMEGTTDDACFQRRSVFDRDAVWLLVRMAGGTAW